MTNRSIAVLAWLAAMVAIWGSFVFNGLSLTVLSWATAVGVGALLVATRWGSGSARSITTLLDDLEAEPVVAKARAAPATGGERDPLRRRP
jgi:hypothetical protein